MGVRPSLAHRPSRSGPRRSQCQRLDGREHEKRLEDDLSRRVSAVMDGRSQLRTTAAWLVLWVLGCPVLASAQAPGQLWLTGTATWLTNDRLQIRVQFEAKDQFIVPDDQPTFLST